MVSEEEIGILQKIIKCGSCIMVWGYQKPCLNHHDEWHSINQKFMNRSKPL